MSFAESAARLQLFDPAGEPLLRLPQHGAAMAVAAHFTARSEAAAIALPTGVGKTAVMTLLPYLLAARRVLVVVPTKLLREQIAEEYSTLAVLRRKGVIPNVVWSPRTAANRKRTEGDAWAAFADRDVVVTTPNSIVDADRMCLVPEGFFDLVLFDEAHHTPAPIWTAVVEHTAACHQVYFTATPYRRDERRIQATIAYEFSLNEAIAKGYVAPVDLRLVDDGADADASLIAEVSSLVTAEGSAYFGTPFIARTSSIEHAKELREEYSAAGLEARVILGDDSLRKARESVEDVRNGDAHGLIMVGVLGEGFDFPAIKIAAYHRAHKSLPATLQFIGRVSRIHGEGPERAIVLATRAEGAEETAALYREDAQWARLIPELADRLFQREAKRALIDRELQTPIQGLVSPSNLRPKRIVDIFAVGPDFDMDVADELDEDPNVVQWWQTDSRRFLVVIRKHDAAPQWLYEPVLIGTEFELQCAIYAPDQGLLFLATNGDSEAFAHSLGIAEPVGVLPERLYAMLNAQGVEAYFNVGMRSIEVPNARRPAYMMNAGQSVGESIRAEDSDTYTLGHAVARITENGQTRSFGIAVRKSRVWMAQSGSLSDFHDWCMSLANLLQRARPATMADGLRLRPETPFELFPQVAIAATPGTRLIEQEATFVWPDGFQAHILDVDSEARVSDDRTFCDVRNSANDTHSVTIRYHPSGAATIEDDVGLVLAGELVSAAEALSRDPYRIFFGDGSSVHGFLMSSLSPGIPAYPATSIETLDWEHVDISKERATQLPGRESIFEFLHRKFAERYPDALIINDDGANELADILVLTNRGAHAEAILFHCKGARVKTEQVDQLYVVAGQAQRSMRWIRSRVQFWKDLDLRRRTRAAFRVVHDPNGIAEAWLSHCAEVAPVTSFHIAVVQPGLASSALRQGTAANVLMSSCKGSADSAGAQFTVFCSA